MAEQYPWESQTQLVVLIGTLASLASAFGLVHLTIEQVAAIGALLVPLIGALRTWSKGEKIVLRKNTTEYWLLTLAGCELYGYGTRVRKGACRLEST